MKFRLIFCNHRRFKFCCGKGAGLYFLNQLTVRVPPKSCIEYTFSIEFRNIKHGDNRKKIPLKFEMLLPGEHVYPGTLEFYRVTGILHFSLYTFQSKISIFQ